MRLKNWVSMSFFSTPRIYTRIYWYDRLWMGLELPRVKARVRGGGPGLGRGGGSVPTWPTRKVPLWRRWVTQLELGIKELGI